MRYYLGSKGSHFSIIINERIWRVSMSYHSLLSNLLYLNMAKKEKLAKSSRKNKAEKIKECNDGLTEIESKKLEKKNRLDKIKDSNDPDLKKEVDQILDEVYELDKQERWNNDRIKMINNTEKD